MRDAADTTFIKTLRAAPALLGFIVLLLPHVANGALECEGDPTRTILVTGQGNDTPPGSCRQLDGNQATCLQAFHVGGDGIASCFYDSAEDECRGCGPGENELDGDCTNTCATTPVCAADPTRTLFTGGRASARTTERAGPTTATKPIA